MYWLLGILIYFGSCFCADTESLKQAIEQSDEAGVYLHTRNFNKFTAAQKEELITSAQNVLTTRKGYKRFLNNWLDAVQVSAGITWILTQPARLEYDAQDNATLLFRDAVDRKLNPFFRGFFWVTGALLIYNGVMRYYRDERYASARSVLQLLEAVR